jgi:RecA-family ATPase
MTSSYPGYDALEDIEPSLRRETAAQAQVAHSGVQFVNAALLAARAPPDRHFLAPGLIPGRNVTLLSGNGGDGKSLLALMLAVAVVGETTWLGVSVASGSAVYVSAEDELDEVHRRLVSICAAEQLNLANFDRLEILLLAGEPALMAIEGKGGALTPTPLWTWFASRIEQSRPALVILDNLSDVFGGNEVSRTQVRQFVSMLRALAFRADCAILILAHPSVSGMSSGTGLSGSTAWNASVRSRLYLTRPEVAKDEFGDPDVRILQSMKSNYGPLTGEIRLRSRLDKEAVEAKAEAVFIDLLQQFTSEGRDVSAKLSRSYAPTQFAAHPDARGSSKRALEAAMNRLLKVGSIRVETTGSPSRQRSRLVFAAPEESAV